MAAEAKGASAAEPASEEAPAAAFGHAEPADDAVGKEGTAPEAAAEGASADGRPVPALVLKRARTRRVAAV